MNKRIRSRSARVALAIGLVLTLLLAPLARRSSADTVSGPFVTFNQVADTPTRCGPSS
ncbi:MAG TPA: hypothetical protein VGV87_08655 [Blastocatellia bacterium]|jgi:hypothetical protein|nr:hypothetical protein [Blastocatellia bacterium]